MTAGLSTSLGPVDDVPLGEGRAYAVGGSQIAVFRLRDGSLHAMDAICPHAGGPLADGQTDARKVVCPLHARAFAFADGACAEDGLAVRVYPVHEQDGQILLET